VESAGVIDLVDETGKIGGYTAHRILERLRDERGFSGGYTIVREYVAQATLRAREMFVPLSHRPAPTAIIGCPHMTRP
jgi:hypothetical protein